MITWFILTVYALLTLLLGWWTGRRSGQFDHFVVAGANRSAFAIFASLMATVIGASSTMGVINLGYKIGFPAFWWLGSGAIGLVLCGLLLAGVVKQYPVVTLADLMGRLVGPIVRRTLSLVIAVAWLGIIAAQFLGAAKIVSTSLGIDQSVALSAVSIIITAYCVMGGQISVIHTDKIQLVFILLAIFLVAGMLWFRWESDHAFLSFELINDSFGSSRITYFLLVTGTGFLAGPDIISRILAAKNQATARMGVLFSGGMLFVVSIAIAWIGLWSHYHLKLQPGQDALTTILQEHLSPLIRLIVELGLLSAIFSSADTCLITAASTLGHDLLGWNQTHRIRIVTVITGLIAFLLACLKGNIIDSLLLAYSLFNCGAIPPVVLAILLHKKRRLNVRLVIMAIFLGGVLGVWGKLAGSDVLTLSGMGISAILSLTAAVFGHKNR